jgi:acetyl esterase/lipase
MKQSIFLFILMSAAFTLQAQDTIHLYSQVPNSKPGPNNERSQADSLGRIRVSRVSVPTMIAFLPAKEKATGAAVIICPGGGYARLAATHEGTDVAKLLNEWGVAAFVLIYRLPNDSIMLQKEIGPLQDAQRAIQLVRLNAKKWNIDAKKVGIMGFSAGGHLAASAGTHFNDAVIDNKQRTNLRPDFMVLLYPVISFTDSLAHMGSRDNLIGKSPAAEKITYYSNELQVTKKTPPVFLVHAKDDRTVKVRNSMAFYEAAQKNNVPSEIHLFEKGGHGFGMINATSPDKWMDWLNVWMKTQGLVKR